jgi:hypothetical protein
MGDLSLMHLFGKGPAAGVALLMASSQGGAADASIGVMTHFAQGWDTSWADTAGGISISGVRDEIYWAQVETSPGVYLFPAAFDAYMARLKRDGISPLVILDFANPLYDGGNTPYTAAGIAAYARYCVAVLGHYGPQIEAVEIWNEYNGSFCTGPATNDRAGTYAAMLKKAYSAIKAARPDVTVLGGSTSGTPIPYWQQLVADGALPYMDALSIHPYRYDTPPEGIENDVASLQALVKNSNNGQSKPIWVTEIGWEEQATPLLVDDATLAKYVTRVYALLLSAGVEKAYWYLLHDDFDEPMGLYDSDGTPKSAAFAMGTLISELGGAPFVRKETTPDNVYSMLFQGTTGRQVRILWSISSRSVDLGGVTKAVDILGNSLGTSGRYTLSDAPIFVEGSVTGVPAPSPSDEVILTSSAADFAGVQGYRGWTYGYVDGAGPFTEMPTYTSDEWSYYWTADFSYLSVTASDMHPSLDGSSPVGVVRRWTSAVSGLVHLVGDFQGTSQGDGVGVAILLDGKPALARELIGAANPASESFDLYETVSVGSTVDFVVDVGPAANMNYDATSFSVQILANGAAAASSPTDAGSGSASAATPLASGTVLADSARDFSGTQGQGGWSYGDYAGGSTTRFEAATIFASNAWSGRYALLAIAEATQHAAIGLNGLGGVAAVRRWTSDYTGNVHVVGSFQDLRPGGGASGTVLINGRSVVTPPIIGAGGGAAVTSFDFVAAVAQGDVIDFAVIPGAVLQIDIECLAVSATISVQ